MSEYDLGDVSVVMGAYNEADAIAHVLDAIGAATDDRAEVIVVDSSSDATAEIARGHGARVIEQPPRGYGIALSTALSAASRPVVVTTDCDDTYPMARIPDFLDYVNEGFDVVSGDRLYHGADTMPVVNRFGNAAFALGASVLAGRRLHDVTTGMRAYRRDVLVDIDWTENTGLSAELLLRPAMRGYDVREVPIDYAERRGETTLDPFSGGAEIAGSILRVCAEERLRRLIPWATL
ncbi:glycosyltransferase family 2 protein [Haladaptatus sp. AB618]|uniref:dolichyl-phosphate hexose transferase n=1 Tax=Haladaptatus sp. AB618 TaxID=2934173 RepID=UPI00209C3742|nr:dolichyl-phosphate hexose transferase [Haladaptatus sp. AB618]MCO8252517.1 glycosyltransferase family 2 protein [Haladaptatus sp. AB618]